MSHVPTTTALEGAHQFPTWFTYKVFGPGTPEFHAQVVATAESVQDSEERIRTDSRSSGGQKYQCVSVEYLAPTAEDVQALYRELSGIDGVRMML